LAAWIALSLATNRGVRDEPVRKPASAAPALCCSAAGRNVVAQFCAEQLSLTNLVESNAMSYDAALVVALHARASALSIFGN